VTPAQARRRHRGHPFGLAALGAADACSSGGTHFPADPGRPGAGPPPGTAAARRTRRSAAPARLALRILSLGRRQKGPSEGASPLVSALTELGPSYIKLGQFFATRPDIIGVEWAGKLAELQDNLAPFDHRAAQAEVETGLGAPLTSLFAEFGPPVAAASIAQVHKAKIYDDDGAAREVAVKVLRPNIERASRPTWKASFSPPG
jgi:predicted unusual protein kinase regulating ubiquinone biosynthesis (AarF/ABC1/UbiB family)